MSFFISTLEDFVNRPVIDKTGLLGNYIVDLKWGKQPNGDEGPALFTAIQEQLGLRLDAERQPVESFVIDSVERPPLN